VAPVPCAKPGGKTAKRQKKRITPRNWQASERQGNKFSLWPFPNNSPAQHASAQFCSQGVLVLIPCHRDDFLVLAKSQPRCGMIGLIGAASNRHAKINNSS
jgi:hypothetical protein